MKMENGSTFKKIYVCSPLSGDMERNIQKARGYCLRIVGMGFLPIAPHIYFTQFLDDTDLEQREIGMFWGNELLKGCDEIWVFGIEQPSRGMKAEIEMAERCGIPIKDGFIVCRKKEAEDGE